MAKAKHDRERRSPYVYRKGYQGEPLPPDARPPRQPSADVPAKKAKSDGDPRKA